MDGDKAWGVACPKELYEFLEQIEVVPKGDDAGVHFSNQISVSGEIIAGLDSYPVPIAFHCTESDTSGKTITNAIDISSILQSDSESSVPLFPTNSSGEYILIGSLIPYEGTKVKYDQLGIVEADNVDAQYYENDVNEWVTVPRMGTNAEYPFDAHGENIAVNGHTSEHIFFGFNPLTRSEPSTWEANTFNINGVDYTYYWGRYLATGDITSSPELQQLKLHTDRTEYESLGIFKFGRARREILLFSGVENTIPNNRIDPANENVEYTQTYTAKLVDNEFQRNRDDGFGITVNRQFGLDTSVPLVLQLSYYVKGNATGDIYFSIRSSQVTDGYVYDGNNLSEDSVYIDTVESDSNLIRKTISTLVPINKLESNSGVVVEISRLSSSEAQDTLADGIVITNVAVIGHVWKI